MSIDTKLWLWLPSFPSFPVTGIDANSISGNPLTELEDKLFTEVGWEEEDEEEEDDEEEDEDEEEVVVFFLFRNGEGSRQGRGTSIRIANSDVGGGRWPIREEIEEIGEKEGMECG